MIYLKINGVTGSVTASGYKGAIEIYFYRFSSKRPVNERTGAVSNRSVGLLHYDTIIFSKPLDEATTELLNYYYNAKVIPELTFYHVATGSDPKCYLQNTFKNSLIQHQGSDYDSERAIETYEFCFTSNEQRVTVLNEQNQLGNPKSIGYDLVQAKVL